MTGEEGGDVQIVRSIFYWIKSMQYLECHSTALKHKAYIIENWNV